MRSALCKLETRQEESIKEEGSRDTDLGVALLKNLKGLVVSIGNHRAMGEKKTYDSFCGKKESKVGPRHALEAKQVGNNKQKTRGGESRKKAKRHEESLLSADIGCPS